MKQKWFSETEGPCCRVNMEMVSGQGQILALAFGYTSFLFEMVPSSIGSGPLDQNENPQPGRAAKGVFEEGGAAARLVPPDRGHCKAAQRERPCVRNTAPSVHVKIQQSKNK